jgi:hypothetical protein
MKLDPGMHIDLHLVFFGKTGVTTSPFLSFFSLKIRSRTKPNVSPLSAKKKTYA